MLGKIEGKRRGWQRIKWLDSITNSVYMNLSKLWEIMKDRGAWHAAVYGVTKARHKRVTEQQQLVISAMILFPNKVTCCGIGDTGDQDLNKPLLENPVQAIKSRNVCKLQ